MKTQPYLHSSCGPIQSLIPTVITSLLALSLGTYAMAGLAVVSHDAALAPAVTAPVAAPAPLCFDHSSEFIAAHGAPVGCPTDPMAYSPAAAFRVQA